MDYRQKRKLSFITIGLTFLLSGIEYAVILPTIWRYLQLLEAPPYFLGLGLSAFSFSGLVSGPVFGHWSDKTRTTKTIILFSNVFEIVGNFMYFMGYSKWLLLSSRLVAGIGAGAGSSIFGFLTRTTLPDERARVFAAVMACRQAGLLIGPAFNIFLRLCDFKLGPFIVNKYTSPGLFMCGMWLLMQFAVMGLYWDIPPLDSFAEQQMPLREVRGEEDEPLMSLEDDDRTAVADSYGSLNPEQTETTLSSQIPPSPPDSPPPDTSDPFENFSASREFLREEVVVLLTAQFITLFNQTALETMVTPLTQKYFGFGELGNSVMYSLCGVEVIAGFFLVRWLSRVLEDRVVLAVGLLICSGACVWCLIFLANPQGGLGFELFEFIIGVFLQLLGLPFVAVSQVSLFSKVTAEKTQGFSQGVRRSVGGLATILGPLWAGGLIGNLYVMLGMMMLLLTLIMIMMVLSYEKLVEPPRVEHAQDSENGG
ncbi:major facilitator superfamily domain-containing protein 8-like [Danio aesculapii]|uniref:major facilitator superfamily domain-containing protein 8 n=1 Tax=Danio aesculapii TaxID=1142201 RepID=UPI0024C0E55F|nr:major facilitator superfamily domain-containing protein 8 [Danio aesculapii]XP_056321871.1 major facilitator superfamily domain-containing protein 8-like [Danio aesculapii]